jgi:hypothetical protein
MTFTLKMSKMHHYDPYLQGLAPAEAEAEAEAVAVAVEVEVAAADLHRHQLLHLHLHLHQVATESPAMLDPNYAVIWRIAFASTNTISQITG